GRVAAPEPRFADVSRAVLGIAREAAREELAVARRDAVQIDLLLEHSAEHLYGVFAIEEAVAGEHFVGDDAEGPDVGAAVDFLSAGLLGRHIGGGAQERSGDPFAPWDGRRFGGVRAGGTWRRDRRRLWQVRSRGF